MTQEQQMRISGGGCPQDTKHDYNVIKENGKCEIHIVQNGGNKAGP